MFGILSIILTYEIGYPKSVDVPISCFWYYWVFYRI